MSEPRRSLNPFRVLLTHRNFRLFWGGQTVSLVGTWMQSVAQGWLALEISDDPFFVGLVAAAGSLPVLFFSLHAGVLADRVDKLRLIIVAQALMLVEAALLWWLVWTGHVTMGWLVGLAFAHGTFQSVDIPSRQALMVELVGREDLVDAIALNSTGFNLARIVGPSIAAVVIAQLGLAWCFGLNALSYLAVLAALLRIQRPPPRVAPSALSPLEGLLEGLRYVRRTPTVAVLVRQTAVFSIFGMPYLTLMPVYARDVLGIGASGYGLLLSAVGVGAVMGALTLASVGKRLPLGRTLYAALVTFALALVVVTVARRLPVVVPALLVAGFAMIVNNALTNGLLQTTAPDAFRGRVMSVYSLVFIGLSPAGSLLAGAVAREAGVERAIGVGALVVLGFALYSAWRHPAVREA